MRWRDHLVRFIKTSDQCFPGEGSKTSLPHRTAENQELHGHIKLIKAELVYQGESQVAALEVENEAYVGVVSISVEQLVNRERHSVVPSGFTPDQPPQIVIAAGERMTITLGNLGPKAPIRIGGVMFADGTEEGCDSSLKSMRELKDFNTKKGGLQK